MSKSATFILLFMITGIGAHGQTEAVRKSNFNINKGVALSGYDPVAYFTQGKAIEGNSKITAQYQGIVYYFSTEDDKALFVKNPAYYEPQYGGWCAYAMGSSGDKVEVDPGTFKIISGKLYLFYNKFFNNTLKTWNKNEAGLKLNADKNWAHILK